MSSTTERLNLDLSALVLHAGDVVVLRNTEREVTLEESTYINAVFQSAGIRAIVLSAEWAIERDNSGSPAPQPSIAQSPTDVPKEARNG